MKTPIQTWSGWAMAELAMVLRVGLAELFVMSGSLKLLGFGDFRAAVEDYRLLRSATVPSAAAAMIGAEFATVVGLLVGGTAMVAACALLMTLLLVTAGAMAINLRRGRRIRCGCFGASSEAMVSWRAVGRNVLLAGAAIVVLLTPVTNAEARAWGGLLPAAVIASIGLVLAALAVEARRFLTGTRRLNRTGEL